MSWSWFINNKIFIFARCNDHGSVSLASAGHICSLILTRRKCEPNQNNHSQSQTQSSCSSSSSSSSSSFCSSTSHAHWKWRLISTGVCAHGTRVDCCPCGNQVKCQSARTPKVYLCESGCVSYGLTAYPILMQRGVRTNLSGRSPMLCYANLGRQKKNK